MKISDLQNTASFLDSTSTKQTYELWTGPIISPETWVILITTNLLTCTVTSIKLYYWCWNITCEVHTWM